jgi:flagellar assembly protein FliH
MSSLAQTWSAPAIGDRAVAAGRGLRLPDDLSSSDRRIWNEAEVAGRAAGHAAAQQEIAARLHAVGEISHSLETVLHTLSRPLSQLDDQVHEQIARLAVAIARGLVRRELRVDPSQVIAIVRDTVALLPASSRGVRVLLHPEDAALVRERLATPSADQAWSIAEDPVLSRGDCRVQTEYAQIDARLESRLSDVLSKLLGDGREHARAESDS